MTPLSRARVATCFAAVAVVGGSEALFASSARADDGISATSPSSSLAPVVPGDDVGAILEAVPALDDTADAGLAATPAGDTGTTAVEGPTEAARTASPTAAGTSEGGLSTPPPPPAEPTAVETPGGGFLASPQPAVDGDQRSGTTGAGDTMASAAETTDTAAPSGDTSADTGSTGDDDETGATAPPPALQSSPSNVNVSVRIGSPGDTGPVTQVNLAALAPAGATDAVSPTGDPPAPGGARGAGSVTPSAAGIGPQPSADAGSGTWAWQWDCLSVPDFTAISDSGSGTGYIPVNWTWIWNCGDNPGQYQGATHSQYRPSNVNVSIRISSPGADGPVTQSNVAVAVVAGVGASSGSVEAIAPQTAPPRTPGLPSPPPPNLAAITAAVAAPLAGVLSPAVAAAAPVTEQRAAVAVLPALPSSIDEQLEIRFVPAPAGSSILAALSAPALRRPMPGRARPATAIGPIAEVGAAMPRPAPVALTSGEASARGDAGAARPGGGRVRDGQRPRWHAPAPQPAPEPAPSAASAAPAAGGGSSSGGIPIFLALPFLAAMLDLARRVVLDGTALPSGHRSRMPDDPG